ncbi:MAG: tetratricopeptide repeat protein [Proteobacteria bacterium]|nr:tetratricopeptide repeat protein [Pseudomonadota bacterium]
MLARRSRLLAAAALVLAAGVARAEPVVQAVPGEGTRSLNAALSRLAHDPRDVDALIAAGEAALGLGDTDAATGFFTRADRLAPNSPRVQAGLAAARVRSLDPYAAIPLFNAAEKGGAIAPEQLVDRGLAYDLVADNARAQTWYRQALAGGLTGAPADEAVRRLALSEAIAGDRRGSEATLSPLLQKNDRAAWRTRAFALAILGREDEAVSIAQSTMPAPLAQAIAPYLRFMRQLTPAQQAAAANLGRFPRAAEIGHDDPRIAQFAPATRLAANDAGLVPAGKPLGPEGTKPAEAPPPAKPSRKPRPEPAAAAPGRPAPVPERAAPPEPEPSRSPSAEAPARLALADTRAKPPVVAAPPPPPPPPPAASPPPKGSTSPAPASAFDLGKLPAAAGNAGAPAPAPAPASSAPVAAPPPPAPVAAPPAAVTPPPAPKPGKPNFAEAFAALGGVASSDAAPARGAVDIRKITPARPKPPPPPPPPPVPSRIWVQMGVGRDTGRLSFTWRKMQKDDPALFKGHKAWFTGMGRTNRLLIGPFSSHDSAEAFLKKAKAANYEGSYIWNSPVGEEVDPVRG